MHIVLVGVNHRSAPVTLRERLAFRQEELPGVLSDLRREAGLEEAAVLSTCNRVEIYAGVAALDGAMERLERFLCDHRGVQPPELGERLYRLAEPGSIRHLFCVASGLDSMVLGEAEILAQVKRAYESARESGATGKVLNTLFQRALNTAKTVRTQTGIGHGCTSIGGVSVELAEKIFGGLSRAVVLLLGAGKIGELTLRRLAKRGARDIRIVNRSLERAAGLAATCGALAVPYERFADQLIEADILISSASVTSPLLGPELLARVMRMRRQRPLCIVDLGVPRNVQAEAGALENVYLFNVDDLQGLVEHSHRRRHQAIEESREIVSRKAERFLDWMGRELGTPAREPTAVSAGHSAA